MGADSLQVKNVRWNACLALPLTLKGLDGVRDKGKGKGKGQGEGEGGRGKGAVRSPCRGCPTQFCVIRSVSRPGEGALGESVVRVTNRSEGAPLKKASADFRWTTGKSIRVLRQSLGMNQADCWSPFGVTQSGASRYESSNRRIPRAVLMLILIVPRTQTQSDAVVKRLRTSVESRQQ